MTRTFLLTVFTFLCAIPVFSQADRDINSIMSDLKQSSGDADRVKFSLELALAYVHLPGENKTTLDSALSLAKNAENINNNSLHDKAIEAKTFFTYSNIYREKGDTATGHAYINKAMAIYETFTPSDDVGEAWLEASRYCNWQVPGSVENVVTQLEKARGCFESSGNKRQLGPVLKTLADYNTMLGNFGQSVAELNEAMVYYQDVKSKNIQDVYDLLDNVYTQLGDYAKAIQYGQMAERSAREAHDTGAVLLTIYCRLATAYNAWTKYKSPESIDYFTKAMNIARQIKDSTSIRVTTAFLVNQYVRMGRPADAINVINRSAGSIRFNTGGDSAFNYKIYLLAYDRAQRFREAKFYADFLVNALNHPERFSMDADVYWGIIEYFIGIHDYQQADKYALQNIAYNETSGNTNGKATAYLYKSQVDSAKGDFRSALANFKLFKAINDTVFNDKKAFQFAQMQVAFNTKQKEDSLKLEQQHSQNLIQTNKAEMARSALIRNIIIGSLLLVLVFLYTGYKLKQNSNRKLEAQQKEINQKNESLTRIIGEKNQLIEEKEWLVKEIHHRVKNNLQLVTSLLNTQSRYLENEEAIKAIAESRHRMQAMSLLHQKLYQSDTSTTVNMQSYIHELTEYLETSFKNEQKIDFQLNIDNIDLDITQAIPVGLVLNEAITNAIKYAFTGRQAGTIFIDMHYQDQKILLSIRDNGQGLSPGFDKDNFSSMGMRLINGLAKQVNGTLSIESKNGLEVRIVFTADKELKQPVAKDLKSNQPAEA